MPKVVDHEKYRDELLLRCFDLFSSRGYSNVTMREIAGELNVSTGSLYYYFPNKQAILQQMFEVIALQEIAQAYTYATRSEEIEKRLDDLFIFFKNRESIYRNIVKLLMDYSRHCTSEENIQFLNKYAKIIFQTISEAAGQDMVFGSILMSFFFGIIYARILVPDLLDFDEHVEIFKKMAINQFLQDND